VISFREESFIKLRYSFNLSGCTFSQIQGQYLIDVSFTSVIPKPASIINCSFHNNEILYGGGVYISTSSKFLSIINNTFWHNTALQGGGIFFSSDFNGFVMQGNVFVNNHASLYGDTLGGYPNSLQWRQHLPGTVIIRSGDNLPTFSFAMVDNFSNTLIPSSFSREFIYLNLTMLPHSRDKQRQSHFIGQVESGYDFVQSMVVFKYARVVGDPGRYSFYVAPVYIYDRNQFSLAYQSLEIQSCVLPYVEVLYPNEPKPRCERGERFSLSSLEHYDKLSFLAAVCEQGCNEPFGQCVGMNLCECRKGMEGLGCEYRKGNVLYYSQSSQLTLFITAEYMDYFILQVQATMFDYAQCVARIEASARLDIQTLSLDVHNNSTLVIFRIHNVSYVTTARLKKLLDGFRDIASYVAGGGPVVSLELVASEPFTYSQPRSLALYISLIVMSTLLVLVSTVVLLVMYRRGYLASYHSACFVALYSFVVFFSQCNLWITLHRMDPPDCKVQYFLDSTSVGLLQSFVPCLDCVC
jgi:hypothetical protein